MTTLGLAHVNFHAHRALLEEMKEFYCDVVGLEVGPRPTFPMPGYWLYAGGEPIVHLYQATPAETRKRDSDGTFDHVAFTCRDCPAVEASLRNRGITYRKSAVPGAKTVQLFLKDPAGNSVELNFST
ncbi:MAG: diguanylate cyclase [Burkholderiales bacterium]|nr:diguanylate cyclase [Burkholderiales bacterium]